MEKKIVHRKVVLLAFLALILLLEISCETDKKKYLLISKDDPSVLMEENRYVYVFPNEKSLMEKKRRDSIRQGLRSPLVINDRNEVVLESENPWLNIFLSDKIKSIKPEEIKNLNVVNGKEFLAIEKGNINDVYVLVKNKNFFDVYSIYIDVIQ